MRRIAGLLQRCGPDPVHPTGEAYGQLAEMLLGKWPTPGEHRRPLIPGGPSWCHKVQEVPLQGQETVLGQ